MSLYEVAYDEVSEFVETADFASAIEVWRKNLLAENGEDSYEPDVQPDSVVLLTSEPVLRGDTYDA